MTPLSPPKFARMNSKARIAFRRIFSATPPRRDAAPHDFPTPCMRPIISFFFHFPRKNKKNYSLLPANPFFFPLKTPRTDGNLSEWTISPLVLLREIVTPCPLPFARSTDPVSLSFVMRFVFFFPKTVRRPSFKTDERFLFLSCLTPVSFFCRDAQEDRIMTFFEGHTEIRETVFSISSVRRSYAPPPSSR